jgi:hypothetical protein
MKHEEIRHKLSGYIDESITPEERAAIEEHLKTCTECSEALRELRKTIEHIQKIEEVESPAWMTQKIMAKVREEQEAEGSIWQRVFVPLFTKFPIQAVAVLFLAVTAYYIYQGINPSRKYTEGPIEPFAKKEAPSVGRIQEESKAVRGAAPEQKQAPQKPGYKSLDMRYSYEKPAAPVPAEGTIASGQAPAKQETSTSLKDEVSPGKHPAAPSAAAPAMMAEQAAPAAGAEQQLRAKSKSVPDGRRTKNFVAADREADIQIDITEHFVKFDLPEKMKKKGLSYRIRKFENDIADLRWLEETNAFRAKPCSSRYVMDVELTGKLSKYFYCYDRSRITLLGIYERKEGTWSEIK